MEVVYYIGRPTVGLGSVGGLFFVVFSCYNVKLRVWTVIAGVSGCNELRGEVASRICRGLGKFWMRVLYYSGQSVCMGLLFEVVYLCDRCFLKVRYQAKLVPLEYSLSKSR